MKVTLFGYQLIVESVVKCSIDIGYERDPMHGCSIYNFVGPRYTKTQLSNIIVHSTILAIGTDLGSDY